MILAIDPGPTESGYVFWHEGHEGFVQEAKTVPNDELVQMLDNMPYSHEKLVIEMIASYGMAVGRDVFETCVWIGRFIQAWGYPVRRVTRLEVKVHHCKSAKAKDSNVRQALIDKYGPVGTKKHPGPCWGISGDMWSALAVATYAVEVPEK